MRSGNRDQGSPPRPSCRSRRWVRMRPVASSGSAADRCIRQYRASSSLYHLYYRALVSASAMTGRELNWGTEVDRRSSDTGECGRKVGDLSVFCGLASSSSVMDPCVYTQIFETESRLYPLACEGIGHDHPQEQCRA